MPSPQTLLTIVLRLGGGVMTLAFPMALLPTATMVSVHEALGLGAFPSPDAPLVGYLTRTLSLLYGFHGVLLLLVSSDVVRYAPIVRFLGIMNITFGLAVLGIDLWVGMPLLWTWGEGPMIAATGVVFLALVSRVPVR